MTADEYEALACRDHAAAVAAAVALGPRALELAVNLSARRRAGTLGSTYTFWLRLWGCPAAPAGWEWTRTGEALRCQRWPIEIRQTGPEAVALARRINEALSGPTQLSLSLH